MYVCMHVNSYIPTHVCKYKSLHMFFSTALEEICYGKLKINPLEGQLHVFSTLTMNLWLMSLFVVVVCCCVVLLM